MKLSDLALERVLGTHVKIEKDKLAEIYSLKARNAKMRWVDSWKDALEMERKKKALQSPFLKEAFQSYARGYEEDLNHFYAGVNALGLLTVIISLSEDLPDVWELEYHSREDAERALQKLRDQQQKLAIMVEASIIARERMAKSMTTIGPFLVIMGRRE